jgi:hypothetical protein
VRTVAAASAPTNERHGDSASCESLSLEAGEEFLYGFLHMFGRHLILLPPAPGADRFRYGVTHLSEQGSQTIEVPGTWHRGLSPKPFGDHSRGRSEYRQRPFAPHHIEVE